MQREKGSVTTKPNDDKKNEKLISKTWIIGVFLSKKGKTEL